MATTALTDELAAFARPLAKKLVRREDARRARILDGVTGGGTKVILGDGTTGNLPSNQHGTIADESVVVAFPGYSLAVDLETLLGEIIADLTGGAGVTAEDADGDPSGVVRTLVFPGDALAIDTGTETATVILAPDYVYWVDGDGEAHWPTFGGELTWEGAA
jgi:hypothetical protein